jgi:pyrroline-5-carboxylate reductase
MADFPLTLACLDGASLGLFGVGHLGRAIGSGLVQNGFPSSRLLVCHGGASDTAARLAEEGLSERVVPAADLARRSRIILYLVRPQNLNAIENCELMDDALIVSFLAGTPMERIPVRMLKGRRVRVMTSAPDTVMKRKAIAAVFPPDDRVVGELLAALHVEQIRLNRESDMHAFTALGVCLPIAFACWRALGRSVDEKELMDNARSHRLAGFEKILQWAHEAEPRFQTRTEEEAYMKRAATPGGVTEAIIERISAGGSLTEALESGIRRSEALGAEPA